MFIGKDSGEYTGSEYHMGVVSTYIEVERVRMVAAWEPSLADMDRGDIQVAVHTRVE